MLFTFPAVRRRAQNYARKICEELIRKSPFFSLPEIWSEEYFNGQDYTVAMSIYSFAYITAK